MGPHPRPGSASVKEMKGRCDEAAVLVLLVGAPRWRVVLTVRARHLKHHQGQIAFPGGRREAGESLQETALREAREEIGLKPSHVRLLGGLSPLYVPPSRFCVYPRVAVSYEPALGPPNLNEVDEILQVPLSLFLDAAHRHEETWTHRGATMRVPYYRYKSHKIWGATAMMLSELAFVIKTIDLT